MTMDKWRAIQYFNSAVERGSFAAAARSFDVSTPAVTQLVRELERSLGVSLFYRTPQGLALTADGERYYETSRRIAVDLLAAEQRVGPRGAKPRGTLTIGMRHSAGHNCIMPQIGRFLVRFPDVEIVAKPVAIGTLGRENVDVAVMVGWPPKRDFLVRHLAQTRHVVCASADYWARAGQPRDPDELRHHQCLVFSNDEGVFVDRWTFTRGNEQRSVDVGSRLFSSDRDWLDVVARAGAGVMRVTDLTALSDLTSGSLVPVLTDWESAASPTIYALYRRSHRQSRLVRVFLEFLSEVFAELENERPLAARGVIKRVSPPEWFGHARGRQSAYAGGRRTVTR
jgi:DNA-binding transcriptional LysR family regulator